jgi:hypothetical protein
VAAVVTSSSLMLAWQARISSLRSAILARLQPLRSTPG